MSGWRVLRWLELTDRLRDSSDVQESAKRRIVRVLLPHDAFVPFREITTLLDAAGEIGALKNAAEHLCAIGILERRDREHLHELVAYRIAPARKADAEALLDEPCAVPQSAREPSYREKRRAERQERALVVEWFEMLERDDPLRPLFTAHYRGSLPFSELRERLSEAGFPGERRRRR